jgi:two-component system, sensor histidine kinase and response regulator
VPIIAMTADAYEDNTIQCRKAGINGHIAKPVDPQNMFREIRKFCGNGEANG